MTKQKILSETEISDLIKKKINQENIPNIEIAESILRKTGKNLYISNYYNDEANLTSISFEIVKETKLKKLSEIVFDIPYFMKDTDFFSKYDFNTKKICERDLGLKSNISLISSIKNYVFSNTSPTNYEDKENNSIYSNVKNKDKNKEDKKLVITSDINLNFNPKIKNEEVIVKMKKRVYKKRKFYASANEY